MLQDGFTALTVAAKCDESGEVTKALLEHKDIDANAVDKVGVFGWQCASGMGVLCGHCTHGMGVVQGPRDVVQTGGQGLQAHRAAAGPWRGMGAWWVCMGLAGDTEGSGVR